MAPDWGTFFLIFIRQNKKLHCTRLDTPIIHSWLLEQIAQKNAGQIENSGSTGQFKQTTSKTRNAAEEITRINITSSAGKFHDQFIRGHSSITSSKRWVGGVRKWQLLMIYSTVNHQRVGWVGLKKSKT